MTKTNTGKRRRHKPQTSRTNVFVERALAFKAADVPGVRLMSKPEVMAIAGASFPTIWQWMRRGTFPRSRIVQGRSMWLSTEVEAWLADLPLRPLKGDAEPAPEAA